MASVKIVISEPQTKKTFQKEIDQAVAVGLIGKKIGDEVSGDIFGLAGYSLQITGGSDSDGFPMHPELKGPGRKRLLLGGTPGFHPWAKGMRKRKMVHGNTISDDIAQINSKVTKKGEKPLEELVPMKPKEKPAKEEKKTEVKAEPKKEAPKAEEKPKEAPKAEQKAGGE
ncbi:30S ribosomal protein S6e [archaeon]|nr:MAG: 30S ribosomal protein S6e [archaeon]